MCLCALCNIRLTILYLKIYVCLVKFLLFCLHQKGSLFLSFPYFKRNYYKVVQICLPIFNFVCFHTFALSFESSLQSVAAISMLSIKLLTMLAAMANFCRTQIYYLSFDRPMQVFLSKNSVSQRIILKPVFAAVVRVMICL